MKIVIAVCEKDLQLAEAQADLIKSLGGLQAHSCLLVTAPSIAHKDGKLASTLAEAFPRFERLALRGGVQEPTEYDIANRPQPHILAANQMFQSAWRHLISTGNKEEVYWLEPDCVPINERWADELARDYLQATGFRRVFLGAFAPAVNFVPKAGGGFTLQVSPDQTYMVGTGIYPPNISQHSGLWAQAKTIPWDAIMQWETKKAGVETKKIVHNHGTAEYKVVEPMKKGQPGVVSCKVLNDWSISKEELVIPADALVIHGCKDTSLIELVSSGNLFKEPEKQSTETKAKPAKKVDQKAEGFIIEG